MCGRKTTTHRVRQVGASQCVAELLLLLFEPGIVRDVIATFQLSISGVPMMSRRGAWIVDSRVVGARGWRVYETMRSIYGANIRCTECDQDLTLRADGLRQELGRDGRFNSAHRSNGIVISAIASLLLMHTIIIFNHRCKWPIYYIIYCVRDNHCNKKWHDTFRTAFCSFKILLNLNTALFVPYQCSTHHVID